MYILSYPGIAFKFPVPSNVASSSSEKDLLNLLHKTDPPCLATSLVIFQGQSWTDIRQTLNQPKPCIITKKKKRTNTILDDPDTVGEEAQIEFAEIFPNEKVELNYLGGNYVSLSYGIFTAQDAITFLGPPSEVYTKSDTRLNIHTNNHRHDEIDTGPLSEGLPPPPLHLLSCR